MYFCEACGTARFTWDGALAEWDNQFDAGQRPNSASSALSDGEVTPGKYDTICKKDKGRKEIVHFCALSE